MSHCALLFFLCCGLLCIRRLVTNECPKTSHVPAEMWLANVQSKLHPLMFRDQTNKRRVLSKPRVKIAMLDTGYDPHNAAILSNSSRIAGYQDFTGSHSSTSACDLSGHGTHGLALLLRSACNANIYVGRVGTTMRDLSEDAVVKVSHCLRFILFGTNGSGYLSCIK